MDGDKIRLGDSLPSKRQIVTAKLPTFRPLNNIQRTCRSWEQMMGQSCTAKADVFSVGAVIYNVCCLNKSDSMCH